MTAKFLAKFDIEIDMTAFEERGLILFQNLSFFKKVKKQM